MKYHTSIRGRGLFLFLRLTPLALVLNCSSPTVPEVAERSQQPQPTQPPQSGNSTFSVIETGEPEGIWSDGTTMWVSDWEDAKIYAYSMRSKARDSANLDFSPLLR